MNLATQPARSRSNIRILIVDDDATIANSMKELLKLEQYQVATASNGSDALRALDKTPYELVISDVNMPQGDGFELLHEIKRKRPATVVIMMTGYGTIESAVEAMKLGAFDYLTKPLDDDDVLLCIERALEQQHLLAENQELRRQLDQRFGLGALIGKDFRMQRVYDLVQAVAGSQVTVLIMGASGTGKSLVARMIHQLSDRKAKPFIEIACGAIPEQLLESELFGHTRGAFTGAVANKEGKFKAAHTGTIFLDEIGTASPALQVKLLRVLQTQQFEPLGSNKTEQVDVRVVLATNINLEQEVREGRFREDLYYRINVVSLDMPSLAERIADLPMLASHFLDTFQQGTARKLQGFSEETLQIMMAYPWPGNVRELENAVQRAVVLAKGPLIEPHDLPPRIVESDDEADIPIVWKPTSLRDALETPEKKILEAALKANGWNRQLTAQQLDINRTTLYKKMKRYGLLDPVPLRNTAANEWSNQGNQQLSQS